MEIGECPSCEAIDAVETRGYRARQEPSVGPLVLDLAMKSTLRFMTNHFTLSVV
jgi:hypothetical protein